MTFVISLLLIVCFLLAIPLDVEFDVRWPESDFDHVRVRWAFGIVSVDRIGRRAATGFSDFADNGQQSERHDPRERSGFFREALLSRASRQRLWRFSGDIWRAAHKRDVRLHAVIGLETPADTGLLWSFLGPVSGVLSSVPDCTIDLRPDFGREKCQIGGQGAVRVFPIQVVGLFLGLLVSPSLWRVMTFSRA